MPFDGETPGTLPVSMCFQRAHKREGFSDSALDVVKTLMPHFQRSLSIRWRLEVGQARIRTDELFFNNSAHGIILFDRNGAPIFVNKMAELIIAENGLLSIRNNTMISSDVAQTNALGLLIDRCIQTSIGLASFSGGAIALKSDSARTLYVTVSPLSLKHDQATPEFSRVCGALFVSADKSTCGIQGDIIRDLFGLTKSEAELLAMLIEGGTLEAFAKKRNVTLHTARKHLKNIGS